MSLAESLVSALEKNEEYISSGKSYLDCNGDHDFGVVLEELSDPQTHSYIFRYSDGKEEEVSFED